MVTVLHPLDVLASRLHNLAEIPEKRNDKGVAQAELAIGIAGAFFRDTLAHRTERELFNQIERIRIIVTNDTIASICREYALDVLSCVPAAQITNENFRNLRWPQIQREVEFKISMRTLAGARLKLLRTLRTHRRHAKADRGGDSPNHLSCRSDVGCSRSVQRNLMREIPTHFRTPSGKTGDVVSGRPHAVRRKPIPL